MNNKDMIEERTKLSMIKLTNQRLSREREWNRRERQTENENGEMNEWGWLFIVKQHVNCDKNNNWQKWSTTNHT